MDCSFINREKSLIHFYRGTKSFLISASSRICRTEILEIASRCPSITHDPKRNHPIRGSAAGKEVINEKGGYANACQ